MMNSEIRGAIDYRRTTCLLLFLVGIATGSVRYPATSKIIGGYPVQDPSPYPWMSRLIFTLESDPSEGKLCGGTIIGDNVILSAAHCVPSQDNWISLHVEFGRTLQGLTTLCLHNKFDPVITFECSLSAEFIPNPGFNEEDGINDIGLIIGENVSFYDYFGIDVPKHPLLSSTKPSAGTALNVIGWGGSATGDSSNVLQEVQAQVQPSSICQDYWGDWYDDGTMFCAGIPGERKGPCSGDSGGPAFEENDCCPVPGVRQFGIISIASEICNEKPSLYTRVDVFLEWIETVSGLQDLTTGDFCCKCDGSSDDMGRIVNCQIEPAHDENFLHDVDFLLAVIVILVLFIFLLLCVVSLLSCSICYHQNHFERNGFQQIQ